MLIAFATVVEKEARWAFSDCLTCEAALWEGILTLCDVGDICSTLFCSGRIAS
jgi:hypothetical protein